MRALQQCVGENVSFVSERAVERLNSDLALTNTTETLSQTLEQCFPTFIDLKHIFYVKKKSQGGTPEQNKKSR